MYRVVLCYAVTIGAWRSRFRPPSPSREAFFFSFFFSFCALASRKQQKKRAGVFPVAPLSPSSPPLPFHSQQKAAWASSAVVTRCTVSTPYLSAKCKVRLPPSVVASRCFFSRLFHDVVCVVGNPWACLHVHVLLHRTTVVLTVRSLCPTVRRSTGNI